MKRHDFRFVIVRCVLFFGLATTQVACATSKVPTVDQLSLRDPRLSLDARRWLADAEDEVVIAQAGVDIATERLNRIKEYQKKLTQEKVFLADSKGTADAAKMENVLRTYIQAQLKLETVRVEISKKAQLLTQARLTQVRAETAIRYDLAIYDMTPIVDEVDSLKSTLAGSQTLLEKHRATVEKHAAELWRTYSAFVKKGGITRNFWKIRAL